jgi:hypothetical protein
MQAVATRPALHYRPRPRREGGANMEEEREFIIGDELDEFMHDYQQSRETLNKPDN